MSLPPDSVHKVSEFHNVCSSTFHSFMLLSLQVLYGCPCRKGRVGLWVFFISEGIHFGEFLYSHSELLQVMCSILTVVSCNVGSGSLKKAPE